MDLIFLHRQESYLLGFFFQGNKLGAVKTWDTPKKFHIFVKSPCVHAFQFLNWPKDICFC